MSLALVQGYSSDEDAAEASISENFFGIPSSSSSHPTKRPRVEANNDGPTALTSAPNVLAEVRILWFIAMEYS